MSEITENHVSSHGEDESRKKSDDAGTHELLRALADMPKGAEEHQRLRAHIAELCLPLATHIARKYRNRGEPADDLVQVARLGLLNAIDRFAPDRESDFMSFAVPTMLGEVRKYFRDSGWAVQVPRRLKELQPRITKAEDQLAQRLGHAPNNAEIAEEIGVETFEIAEGLAAHAAYKAKPISASASDEPGLAETLGGTDGNFTRVDNQATLVPLLAALTNRERRVVALTFFQSLTQRQIAALMGISQMHVSRLLADSLAHMRAWAVRRRAGVRYAM